jgi:hypothetical protein
LQNSPPISAGAHSTTVDAASQRRVSTILEDRASSRRGEEPVYPVNSDAMRETKTAMIQLEDEGVLVVRIRDGAKQLLPDAEQNLGAALIERGGKRRPLLIDIRDALPLDADVRHYYSGQVLVSGFTALALVVDASPLGKMMGNVYFRVARPGIPTRLFTESGEARQWLSGYRE